VTAEKDGRAAQIDDAYTYWPFDVRPRSGPVGGGTRLELIAAGGAAIDAREVRVGNAICRNVTVEGTQLACTTPAADTTGPADVVVVGSTGQRSTAADAFAYTDALQLGDEGIRGAALAGQLEVAVYDPSSRTRQPDALVVVQDGGERRWVGRTDDRGTFTISDPALRAPVDVHVFGRCEEHGSILGVDRDVVIFQLAVDCPEAPSLTPGHPLEGGTISGRVVIPGGWEGLPVPREGERRLVRLATTKARIDIANPTPDPDRYGAEFAQPGTPDPDRIEFSILVRPAALAVYAIAGIASDDGGTFIPYAMGIARGVTVAPGQELRGVDITVDMALDTSLEVAIDDLPAPHGGQGWEISAVLDLGAEGVLDREAGDRMLDRSLLVGLEPALFLARPAAAGVLSDARLRVRAAWSDTTGDVPGLHVEQIFAATETSVAIGGALGLPELSTPAAGERVPATRTLEWTVTGEPDVQTLTIGALGARWELLAPGTLRRVVLPDPTALDPARFDPLSSANTLLIEAARVYGFDGYRGERIEDARKSHSAINSFPLLAPIE
jgi:hypothetical protein